MSKIIGNFSIILIIILISSSLSFGQEGQGRRGMDLEKVKILEKASDEALEDVKDLARQAEKIVAFRQANEKAYGFPSDLQDLQKMQVTTESFENNELKKVLEFYESLQDKYNATGANDLNVAMSKVINPFPAEKINFPWSANTLEQNMAWLEEFKPELEKAIEEAKEIAEATTAEQNKAKQLSDLPDDNYSEGDLADLKEQMLNALLGSVIKDENEVTGIAVISDWVEGKYTDSKQPYRKINGTVLFADNDDDGISRFTSYVFISNEVNGDWQPLKFKSFCNGCPEGWTGAGSGSMGSGGDGFLGSLLWFVLAIANILAGSIAAKTVLNKYHAVIEKIISFLTPYSIQIGLVALAAGVLSFVMSLLGLRLLYGIIPQLTAVLLGIILAYDYIQANAKGKLKDQMENSQEMVSKVNVYAQTIGLIGLATGFVYLLFNGSFYFI
jgi:NTP pyrophosphatase (non-canonical NTP hydrolase)